MVTLTSKKPRTDNEIWRDSLLDRLNQVFVAAGARLPAGYRLDLENFIPTEGKSAYFSLLASGQKQPLSYGFTADMAPDACFRIMPCDPAFVPAEQNIPGGYSFDNAENAAARFASDMVLNYKAELADPRATHTNPRLACPKHVIFRPN